MKRLMLTLAAATLLITPESHSFATPRFNRIPSLGQPLQIAFAGAAVALTAYALYRVTRQPTLAEQIITIEFHPAATIKIQDVRAAFDGKSMSESLFLQALKYAGFANNIRIIKRTALQDGFVRLEIHYKGPQQSAEGIRNLALSYLSLRIGRITTNTVGIIDPNADLEKPAPAELVDL